MELDRPNFPKKVIITAGMPNGNKPLHIGHIGAVFIWADVYARYLRDNIGKENVIFISGTDGFGSSTEEKYRKLYESKKTSASLPDFVKHYHDIQSETLKKYQISLNLFGASCFEPHLTYHKQMSDHFFNTLYTNGSIEKKQTKQFYDNKYNVILNGRQVEGICPIVGCKSEIGYADECSLGHQYNSEDLINPISTLSGETPEMKLVSNFYFNLDNSRSLLKELVNKYENEKIARKFMIRDMKDYLLPPSIYTSSEYSNLISNLNLPDHQIFAHNEGKMLQIMFKKVNERDEACDVFKTNNIKYRTNKTLAPLRISGNAKWGVPLTTLKNEPDTKDLTFYVWPESLWAPISFTESYLNKINSDKTWKDWWCDKDTKIVQFIGEDNIYFYCLAEMGMFLSMQGNKPELDPQKGQIQIPLVVANKHLLFSNIKASSSGSNTAPTADNLLNFYTVDQLRCHFLGQNIPNAASNFRSKVFSPNEFENSGDPVVSQGNMLTNIFNRIIRSVFYTNQQYFDGKLPDNDISTVVKEEANNIISEYEKKMNEFKFNEIITLLNNYFKQANLNWSNKSKSQDLEEKKQLITDTIHVIKTGTVLLHPLVPESTENVASYLNADDELWNWNNLSKSFKEVYPDVNNFKEIPPQFDFFKKHQTQLNEKKKITPEM